MKQLLGINITDEEFDFLMNEQTKGKELRIHNGKIIAEFHVETEQEYAQRRIFELKYKLKELDYINAKQSEVIANTLITNDLTELNAFQQKYATQLTLKQQYRDEINELKKKLEV